MKLTGYETDELLLKEIGSRIKQHRLAMNLSQSELASKSGVSLSTLVRIEMGEDTKLSNIIKLLRAEYQLSGIDMLISEPQHDFKAEFENTPKRQRASRKKTNINTFVWGEDK